jgi:hypothetical protein
MGTPRSSAADRTRVAPMAVLGWSVTTGSTTRPVATGASWQRGAHRSLRLVMRPHRSGFQLETIVCVQIGEAIVDQLRRPHAGSRRLIRSAASAARETANAASRNQPVLARTGAGAGRCSMTCWRSCTSGGRPTRCPGRTSSSRCRRSMPTCARSRLAVRPSGSAVPVRPRCAGSAAAAPAGSGRGAAGRGHRPPVVDRTPCGAGRRPRS